MHKWSHTTSRIHTPIKRPGVLHVELRNKVLRNSTCSTPGRLIGVWMRLVV